LGLTFDTGALMALERRNARMATLWRYATAQRHTITVPTVVVAEWWRGRSDRKVEILEAVDVEPLTRTVAALAGEALAAVRGSTTVDAIVMASAALRGDVVYTSDVPDLMRLQRVFPGVRVMHA
jgi:predicted nucleic acid-binding protein